MLTVPLFWYFFVNSLLALVGSDSGGPDFEANPVGVEFDPEEWLGAVRDGASLEDFRIRKVHEPVSPIRGAISALL